jgi:two-component system, NarL family, sensor histidine kinase UhpB
MHGADDSRFPLFRIREAAISTCILAAGFAGVLRTTGNSGREELATEQGVTVSTPHPARFVWQQSLEISASLAEHMRRMRSAAAPSRWLWYDRSIRWQLLATFTLIHCVAALSGTALMLYNAKRATQVEMESAVELAEHIVRGPIDQLARETAGASPVEAIPFQTVETLPLRIRNLRHVEIHIVDAQGRRISQLASPDEREQHGSSRQAPRWFTALFQFEPRSREVPVTFGGRHVGTVIVRGEAADEIAEVWQDLSEIALVAVLASASALALLYLALGRVLNPLSHLATGLHQLEQGRFQYRLPSPRVRELAAIAHSFNALAGALDAEKTDNVRLNRRLITVQDDERRQIAMELHDELGPCLFGLKANVASLGRSIEHLPCAPPAGMRERIATLMEIVDRIQSTNRRLLSKILPMSIGHAPLADVIANLVADFERHDPDPAISLDVNPIARSYGDCIDLTVYRCVQEGLTNAVRHANATCVEVKVEQRTTPRLEANESAGRVALFVSVQDDGRGIEADAQRGLGLTAMEERIRALGGTFVIMTHASGGTCLSIRIPLDETSAGPL